MLRTSFLLQKLKSGSNSVNTGNRVTVVYILQFSSWPSFGLSSFIKLSSILLEICSGQKCDGQMDIWTAMTNVARNRWLKYEAANMLSMNLCGYSMHLGG